MKSGMSGRKYGFLEQLSPEELESLLRLRSDSDEKEAFYDAVVEVILEKEEKGPPGHTADVDQAWRDFQKLCQDSKEKEKPGPEALEALLKGSRPKRSAGSRRQIWRSVALVALTAALLFTLLVGAQAGGLNVFGTLARWTADTFSFVAPYREAEEDLHLPALPQGSLSPQDVLGEFAPTWYPEGTEVVEISTQESQERSSRQISYTLPNANSLLISLGRYPKGQDINNIMLEKDTVFLREYPSHAKTYYLFSNENRLVATWSDGAIVLVISGSLTEEELTAMIDSIGGST